MVSGLRQLSRGWRFRTLVQSLKRRLMTPENQRAARTGRVPTAFVAPYSTFAAPPTLARARILAARFGVTQRIAAAKANLISITEC